MKSDTITNTGVPFALAAAIMLLGVVLYDTMGVFVKLLGADYPAPQLSFLRNLFGLVPALVILLSSPVWAERGRPVRIRQWRLALARGFLGAGTQICLYIGLVNLEFATAITIVFSASLFVTALSVPILGHTVGWPRWLAVGVGFAGVVMVMQPAGDSFTWYAVLPLIAACGIAITSVTAKLIDDDVPTTVLNLYYSVGTLVGTALLMVATGDYVAIASWGDWGFVVAMGLAGGLAAYCWTSAHRLADPSSLSPFQYFGIPSSFVLGWLVFAEAPFDRLMPGALFIVGAGMIILWRERALKKGQSVD